MIHFCDDAGLDLNFCASWGKIARETLNKFERKKFSALYGIKAIGIEA